MSSPRAEKLSALIDRVLANFESSTQTELAATLGVDSTYVGKLRGGWRPGRVRQEIHARLTQLDPTGASKASQPAAFYDGILYAAQAYSETQARLIAMARAGLAAGSGLKAPTTPSFDAIEDGVAALRQVPPPAKVPSTTKKRA